MKLITYSKIGYNHPSQANWSYGIWKIDFVDTKRDYCGSETVKETFGGDSRFRIAVAKLGYRIIETKTVYTGTGTPKITGIASMQDIECDNLLDMVKYFMKN